MWQSVQILSVFNRLTLKLISWKMNTFFKKLEYRFLVESTKIENASSPCKPGVSEAIVKRNKMVTIIWTYQKEQSFANNYFIFWKFCFSLRTSYTELICCTNNPNDHYCTFCKRWSFIWQCFFAVHCAKSVQIRSNFLFVFSRIRTECGAYLSVFSPNTGNYGPEITPYLDTFHAVVGILNEESCSHVPFNTEASKTISRKS